MSLSDAQEFSFQRSLKRLRWLGEHSEFYRERFDAASLNVSEVVTPADFARVPTITKLDLIEDQATYAPYGRLFAMPGEALGRVFRTANALYVLFTEHDFNSMARMNADLLTVMGVRPTDVVDVASTYHWVLGGLLQDAALRLLGAAVIAGGPGNTEQRLRVLEQAEVTVLQAFTPYAEELVERAREAGVDPATDFDVRLLLIGGEMRTPESRSQLSAAWGGASAREFYGTSEVGVAAAECELECGMHVSPECYLEVVDPASGDPVGPGQSGEIVLTELYREAQPIMRFKTGDITEWVDTSPCECGRTTPRLGRIIGRTSDVKRVRGLFLAPSVVRSTMARYPNVDRWRVVIDRPKSIDELVLQLHGPGGRPVDDVACEAIMSALREATSLRFRYENVAARALQDAEWCEDRRRVG